MLSEMSVAQFRRWVAFYESEPSGDARADWHAASICAAIWNTALLRVGSKRQLRVSDFLLEFGSMPKELKEVHAPRKTWQELKNIVLQWHAVGSKKK